MILKLSQNGSKSFKAVAYFQGQSPIYTKENLIDSIICNPFTAQK